MINLTELTNEIGFLSRMNVEKLYEILVDKKIVTNSLIKIGSTKSMTLFTEETSNEIKDFLKQYILLSDLKKDLAEKFKVHPSNIIKPNDYEHFQDRIELTQKTILIHKKEAKTFTNLISKKS